MHIRLPRRLDAAILRDASQACTPPLGYVGADNNRNASAAAVNPDADEHCNGIDDDGDGTVDDDDAHNADTWYLDYDGDGGNSYDTSAAASPSATCR